jgi:hypothetical protein
MAVWESSRQLVVRSFSNIEVVPSANSPHDYSNMHHGAL